MPHSRLIAPLRLTVRGARSALRTTRDAAELGLAALDLVERVLGDERSTVDVYETDTMVAYEVDEPEDLVYVDEPPAPIAEEVARLAEDLDLPGEDAAQLARDVTLPTDEVMRAVQDVEHIDEEVELVETSADAGAVDGAGATIRIDPPFAGYDALRGPDVIARLPTSDAATLAAIELYEQTHRARRTVLAAIARESRRRG